MKRIDSILRAYFLMLTISSVNPTGPVSNTNERPGAFPIAGAKDIRTSKTQPELDRPGVFKAGVLISDYLAVMLIYCLILALRNFGKEGSANARRVQLSNCCCTRNRTTEMETDAKKEAEQI